MVQNEHVKAIMCNNSVSEGGFEMRHIRGNIYDSIKNVADIDASRIAITTESSEMTYGDLWDSSEKLAVWLKNNIDNDRPLMVYGHKSPYMLVCFLACVKSGHAYCPVDVSMPKDRIQKIAEIIDNAVVLSTEPLELEGFDVITRDELEAIIRQPQVSADKHWRVSGDETFYIIFTSGSTGTPKGVEVSEANLRNFLSWSAGLAKEYLTRENSVFLNQAPFSFDLSVFDTYTSLATGGTLVCLDKKLISNAKDMFEFMKEHKPECWVSTPSFADMCLADRNFSEELIKDIKVFLFCGETLSKSTAAKLMERFPDAAIVNTYGPTESTVAVTSVEITRDIMDGEGALPVGVCKPGTEVIVENGEIVILGNTVAKGYYKDLEKTKGSFGLRTDSKGMTVKSYRTGDKGYYRDGMLYCEGRLDFQIKMHGYRIELGDIEENLMKIQGIEGAAVLPKYDEGKIRHLVAFVKAPTLEGGFKTSKCLKGMLKESLPSYMVPKQFIYLDELPITGNGKLDRKRLEELIR